MFQGFLQKCLLELSQICFEIRPGVCSRFSFEFPTGIHTRFSFEKFLLMEYPGGTPELLSEVVFLGFLQKFFFYKVSSGDSGIFQKFLLGMSPS